jgi:hypothetical protein
MLNHRGTETQRRKEENKESGGVGRLKREEMGNEERGVRN